MLLPWIGKDIGSLWGPIHTSNAHYPLYEMCPLVCAVNEGVVALLKCIALFLTLLKCHKMTFRSSLCTIACLCLLCCVNMQHVPISLAAVVWTELMGHKANYPLGRGALCIRCEWALTLSGTFKGSVHEYLSYWLPLMVWITYRLHIFLEVFCCLTLMVWITHRLHISLEVSCWLSLMVLITYRLHISLEVFCWLLLMVWIAYRLHISLEVFCWLTLMVWIT